MKMNFVAFDVDNDYACWECLTIERPRIEYVFASGRTMYVCQECVAAMNSAVKELVERTRRGEV